MVNSPKIPEKKRNNKEPNGSLIGKRAARPSQSSYCQIYQLNYKCFKGKVYQYNLFFFDITYSYKPIFLFCIYNVYTKCNIFILHYILFIFCFTAHKSSFIVYTMYIRNVTFLFFFIFILFFS